MYTIYYLILSDEKTAIYGGGSSFAQDLYDSWATAYNQYKSDEYVSYNATDSHTGLAQLDSGTVIFAGLEIPAEQENALYVPSSAGNNNFYYLMHTPFKNSNYSY